MEGGGLLIRHEGQQVGTKHVGSKGGLDSRD